MGMIDISRNNAAVADAVLVIHGGAGTILEENLTSEREAACYAGLEKAEFTAANRSLSGRFTTISTARQK